MDNDGLLFPIEMDPPHPQTDYSHLKHLKENIRYLEDDPGQIFNTLKVIDCKITMGWLKPNRTYLTKSEIPEAGAQEMSIPMVQMPEEVSGGLSEGLNIVRTFRFQIPFAYFQNEPNWTEVHHDLVEAVKLDEQTFQPMAFLFVPPPSEKHMERWLPPVCPHNIKTISRDYLWDDRQLEPPWEHEFDNKDKCDKYLHEVFSGFESHKQKQLASHKQRQVDIYKGRHQEDLLSKFEFKLALVARDNAKYHPYSKWLAILRVKFTEHATEEQQQRILDDLLNLMTPVVLECRGFVFDADWCRFLGYVVLKEVDGRDYKCSSKQPEYVYRIHNGEIHTPKRLHEITKD